MILKADNKYIYCILYIVKPNDKKFPPLTQDLFYVCIRGQAARGRQFNIIISQNSMVEKYVTIQDKEE